MSRGQDSNAQPSPRSLDDNEPNERWTPAPLHTASLPSLPEDESASPRHRRTPTSSSSKRNSFFGLRSRSNTTSTISSSIGVGTSSPGAEDNSRESSQSVRRILDASPTLLDRPHSRANSLFSRSKKVSRQSSKLSLITWDGSDTWLDNKRYGRRAAYNAETRYQLKRAISEPFNFQHVAHSQHKEFANLDQTSQNELIAEYWAVRAAQRPRPDLRGIRAADLYSSTFPAKVTKAPAGFHETPPLEPVFPPLVSTTSPQEVVVRSPRNSPSSHSKPRSAVSFSQPIVRTASQKTALSPPRTPSLEAVKDDRLSLAAPQDSHPSQGHMPIATIGTVIRARPDRTPFSKKRLRTFNLAITLSDSAIAQAVTTADETGCQLRTPLSPAYSTDLEDVPEECENYFVERNPTDSPSHGVPSSPPVVQFPMEVDARLSPPVTPHGKRSRPMSQTSDTLGTPFTPLSPRLSLPISFKEPPTISRGFDTSWYDDIDYCYENAAEASCDFQWGPTAKEMDMISKYDLVIQSNNTTPASTMIRNRKADQPTAARAKTEPQQHKPGSEPHRPAVAPTPIQDAIPDSEARLTRSWSNGNGVAIPLDTPTRASSKIKGDNTAPLKESDGSTVQSSSFIPGDSKTQIGNESFDGTVLMEGLSRHDLMSEGYSDFFSRNPSSSTVRSVSSPNRLGSEDDFLKSRALGSVRGSPVARNSSKVAGSRPGRKNSDQVVDSLSQDIESLVRLDEPLSADRLQNEQATELATTPARSSEPKDGRSDDDAEQHRSSSRPSAEASPSTAIPLTPPPKSRARSATYLAGAVPRRLSNRTYKGSLVPAPLSPCPRPSMAAST